MEQFLRVLPSRAFESVGGTAAICAANFTWWNRSWPAWLGPTDQLGQGGTLWLPRLVRMNTEEQVGPR